MNIIYFDLNNAMRRLRDFILRLVGLETEESRLGDSYNSKPCSQTYNRLETQLYRQLRQAKQLPLPCVEDAEVLDEINKISEISEA